MDELDRRKLWDKAYVFFLGDNGFMCGSKGWNGKVVPWEESVRVPFFAAGGKVRRGVRSDAPVTSVDLPATWLELAGVKPAYKLAGRSMMRVLITGRRGPEAGFQCLGRRPTRGAGGENCGRALPSGAHVHAQADSLGIRKQAMYDIRRDPGEDRDLLAETASATTVTKLS